MSRTKRKKIKNKTPKTSPTKRKKKLIATVSPTGRQKKNSDTSPTGRHGSQIIYLFNFEKIATMTYIFNHFCFFFWTSYNDLH